LLSHVLEFSSAAKTAEAFIAHPENEEANGLDKHSSLKLTSKKVILCCQTLLIYPAI